MFYNFIVRNYWVTPGLLRQKTPRNDRNMPKLRVFVQALFVAGFTSKPSQY